MVAIGEVIDEKYRITRLIGEGGMGAVFEGENLNIGRRVAIKVLHAAIAMDKQVVERFQREARAAGRIGNDHILEVLDLGKLSDGDHYMVLEFLDGEPLSNRIERLGRMTPAMLLPLASQMLDGLGAAHRAGIVHRDLKPDNIFILKEKAGRRDFVKIIDFGISKFSPLAGGTDSAMKMTQTGAIMGTPYYMSPEQARGTLEIDARSDIYSIGVILYEAATGTVPFTGATVNELMFNIVLTEPRPLRELVPDIDAGFEAIVTKALVKDRERRFQSTDEFAAALAECAQGGSPRILVPEIVAANPAAVPSQSTAAMPDASTNSSWVQTQAGAGSSRRLSKGMIAATAAGIVLLASIIATFASLGDDSGAASAPSSSAKVSVAVPPPTALIPPAVKPEKIIAAENPTPPATSAAPVASTKTPSVSASTASAVGPATERKTAPVARKGAPASTVASPVTPPERTGEAPKKTSAFNQFGY